MANKVEYVRERFPIVETAQGKGLKMTIEVTRYAGMILVNGNPIGEGRTNSALSASRFILQGLEELETQWAKRQEQEPATERE
jgi:hypothetical protein